jgi:sporulation protein YlmC with PRC-barrel domain
MIAKLCTASLCTVVLLGTTSIAHAQRDAGREHQRNAPVQPRGSDTLSAPEARQALAAMRASNRSLTDAIKAAERHCDGTAVSATMHPVRTGTGGGTNPAASFIEVCVVTKTDEVKNVMVDLATNNVVAMGDGSMGTGGAAAAAATTVLKYDDVVGKNVKNPQGESLGEIEDLAIDRGSGRIAYAVLSFGGVLGLNERLFAVPWSVLKNQRGEHFVLDLDKETLKNAPGFDKKSWPDFADPAFASDIERHYRSRPWWEGLERERQGNYRIERASAVVGRKVENEAGENLGKIESLAIDSSGRIAYAVLSFGGFLGMGDKLFAIPWDALTIGDKNVILPLDKERLKNAPGFDKKNWPNMANEAWAREVRDYYNRPAGTR